jgi:hypothetical protein
MTPPGRSPGRVAGSGGMMIELNPSVCGHIDGFF